MSKTIKVLSIIAVVLAGISIILACFFLTVFWEMICIALSAPDVVLDIGPRISIGNLLYVIGCFIFALIIFFTNKERNNIIIEVVTIVSLSVIFPVLSWWIGIVEVDDVAFLGERYYYAFIMTKDVLVLPISIMKLSLCLCLVNCGMRISKNISNKTNNNAIDKEIVLADDEEKNTYEKYDVRIFDAENKNLRKETREIDTVKFPLSKYAFNDTYYAIEKIKDGKKVRIYYEKSNWDKQIENNL